VPGGRQQGRGIGALATPGAVCDGGRARRCGPVGATGRVRDTRRLGGYRGGTEAGRAPSRRSNGSTALILNVSTPLIALMEESRHVVLPV